MCKLLLLTFLSWSTSTVSVPKKQLASTVRPMGPFISLIKKGMEAFESYWVSYVSPGISPSWMLYTELFLLFEYCLFLPVHLLQAKGQHFICCYTVTAVTHGPFCVMSSCFDAFCHSCEMPSLLTLLLWLLVPLVNSYHCSKCNSDSTSPRK